MTQFLERLLGGFSKLQLYDCKKQLFEAANENRALF